MSPWIVKLWPGESEQLKGRDWTQKVYKPDIQGKWNQRYQKPGYDPL